MVLSEVEAEAQLAELRRQREALDRAIGDLTLYLELGRRLTDVGQTVSSPGTRPDARLSTNPTSVGAEHGVAFSDRRQPGDRSLSPSRRTDPNLASADAQMPYADVAPDMPRNRTFDSPAAGTSGADHAIAGGALSEGVLARRYGRALIEAALAALEESGRPLHAAEILAVLTGRGFSLPGHDPVAALNTRLWKRSGPGGLLKRMGDAVYALADAEDGG